MLKAFFIIAIPETTLTLIIGLMLLGIKINKNKKIVAKIIFSIVTISITLILIRMNKITNIQLLSFISCGIYTITYKIIFECNWRKSLIIGNMSMFIILFSEVIFLPILNIDLMSSSEQIQITAYTRIFECLILLIILKLNINIENFKIINKDWEKLSFYEKRVIVVTIILLNTCIIFNASYSQLYFLIIRNIEIQNLSIFKFNLVLYFLQNLIFLFLVLYFMNTIRNYWGLRSIIKQEEEKEDYEKLFDLLERCNYKTLKKYKEVVNVYIEERSDENEDN